MNRHYEDERKIYSINISKESISVLIQTKSHHIRGFVHASRGKRLIEKLNNSDSFIAVTKATVYDFQGAKEIYKTNFISVNRESVIWVIPELEIEVDSIRHNQP